MGDLGLIPGLGRSLGEGKGDPLHYVSLENSMDCIVHEVTKSWTQLSNFHFQGALVVKKSACQGRGCLMFDPWHGKVPWREEMAMHPSILAWEIPWAEEPGDYSPWGCRESDTTGYAHRHIRFSSTNDRCLHFGFLFAFC